MGVSSLTAIAPSPALFATASSKRCTRMVPLDFILGDSLSCHMGESPRGSGTSNLCRGSTTAVRCEVSVTDSSAPSGGAASAQVSGASGSPLVRQNYQSRPRSNSQSNTVEDLTPSSSQLPFPFIMSCDWFLRHCCATRNYVCLCRHQRGCCLRSWFLTRMAPLVHTASLATTIAGGWLPLV